MFISVCDDNSVEMDGIVRFLEKMQCIDYINTFTDPRELLASLTANHYDIIFLDICLPHLNGIDTAKEIRNVDADVFIIFITAANNFSLEAFSVYATDYILKPVNLERLAKTVNWINEKSNLRDNKIVEVKTQNVVHRIRESDIVFIEKVMNRCMVYTENFTFDVLSPLKYFEELLDENKFIRSHAGYLVHRDKIAKIDVNGNLSYTLHFFNMDKTALVSRSKKDKLFERISNICAVVGG